jgi:hypothetical protein
MPSPGCLWVKRGWTLEMMFAYLWRTVMRMVRDLLITAIDITSPFFLFYFFTATRNLALRARGL